MAWNRVHGLSSLHGDVGVLPMSALYRAALTPALPAPIVKRSYSALPSWALTTVALCRAAQMAHHIAWCHNDDHTSR